MIICLQNAIPKNLIEMATSQCGDFLENNKNCYESTYNRMGQTVSVSKDGLLVDLDSEIKKFMFDLSEKVIKPRYSPQFPIGDSGYEFHRYNDGDQCLVHSDQEIAFGTDSAALIRFATVVLHLNTVEEGGETVFPNQNKSFKTIEGQVLIFPPHGTHPHYVTPCKGKREILMTWMVYVGINAVRVQQ